MIMKISTKMRLAIKHNMQFKLLHMDKYAEMQEGLEQEVSLFNNSLYQINLRKMGCPLHRSITISHSRGKGRVSPRYKELIDGCHPKKVLLNLSIEEIYYGVNTCKQRSSQKLI